MVLEYEHLTDPISLKIMEKCRGSMPPGEIILKKSGTILPENFVRYYERFKNFEVREDDIWVITFPKCGTTWTQEMVWLLMNNLDYEAAKEYIFVRFPFLDRKMLYGENSQHVPETISLLNQQSSLRFIKTHLPSELLPEQIWTKRPKIIYVSRDPKDAAVSYFHHYILLNNYKGTQDEFIEAFLADRVISSPYWAHVLGYWKLRHEPNILFNTFEDMKQDLRTVLKRTASFLEKNITEEEEHSLLTHLSFENMKQNKAVNYETVLKKVGDQQTSGSSLMREGGSGTWKKNLTAEQIEKFDSWSKQWLEGTGCDLYKEGYTESKNI